MCLGRHTFFGGPQFYSGFYAIEFLGRQCTTSLSFNNAIQENDLMILNHLDRCNNLGVVMLQMQSTIYGITHLILAVCIMLLVCGNSCNCTCMSATKELHRLRTFATAKSPLQKIQNLLSTSAPQYLHTCNSALWQLCTCTISCKITSAPLHLCPSVPATCIIFSASIPFMTSSAAHLHA